MRQPTRPPVNHHDLVRITGYSQSTISRALDPEKQHLVKSEVIEEIRRVAHSLGYRNNINARRLRSGLARTLSLVMPEGVYAPPAFPAFELGGHLLSWLEVKGTIEAAEALAFDIKLIMPPGPGNHNSLADRVGFPHSDGVILVGNANAEAHLAGIRAAGVPYIVTGARSADHLAPLIHLEQGPGIAEAVAHLHARGRTSIAYATFDATHATSAWGRPRIDAYTSAVTAVGGTPRILVATSPLRLMVDLLAQVPRDGTGAILCVNDSLARLVVNEALRAGLTVPKDLAVVGFDDNPIFHGEVPRLSTIRMEHGAMGAQAATRLIGLIRSGEAIPPVTTIPSVFIPGATS